MSLARIPRCRKLPATTTLSPALRLRIENCIEHLLILLDTLDSDPDLEDGGDQETIDEREPEDDGDELDLGEQDPAWGLA